MLKLKKSPLGCIWRFCLPSPSEQETVIPLCLNRRCMKSSPSVLYWILTGTVLCSFSARQTCGRQSREDEKTKEEHQVGGAVPWWPEVHEMSPLKNFNALKNIGIRISMAWDGCTVEGSRKAPTYIRYTLFTHTLSTIVYDRHQRKVRISHSIKSFSWELHCTVNTAWRETGEKFSLRSRY